MSEGSAGLRLDDQLCFALYAATNAVTRIYRPLLDDIDLTYPQYLVMLALWQEQELTVRGVADRLQLQPSAVTPLITRLELSGFVERRRDGRDNRIVRVRPTPRGWAAQAAAADAQAAVTCRVGLDEEAFAALRQELLELAARLARGRDDADDRRPAMAGEQAERPSS